MVGSDMFKIFFFFNYFCLAPYLNNETGAAVQCTWDNQEGNTKNYKQTGITKTAKMTAKEKLQKSTHRI